MVLNPERGEGLKTLNLDQKQTRKIKITAKVEIPKLNRNILNMKLFNVCYRCIFLSIYILINKIDRYRYIGEEMLTVRVYVII